MPNLQFSGNLFKELWAGIQGTGGLIPTIQTLEAEVAIIFRMHGDGTLSPTGVLTVTKTNGVPFGYFATGTDASHRPERWTRHASQTVRFLMQKLVNAVGAELLGADAAGPITAISIGAGLALSGGTLASNFTGPAAVAVGSLGAATATKRAFVTDSTVTAAGNFGNMVVGGGANFCPVYADGSDWRIG